MNDLRAINQAVFDTLERVAPGENFVLVIWSEEHPRAAISSNELSVRKVVQMLTTAAEIVASTNGGQIALDDIETAGSA